MADLVPIHESLWLYVAAPILLGAAVWVTWVLRAPQFTRLSDMIKALRETDADADGETVAFAPSMLTVAATIGAAAAVGTATAVSLAGAGVLFWIWLFAFIVAPLRYAEVVLARTDAVGKSDTSASGSLARRLMREDGPMRPVGMLLTGLLLVVGFAFIGGVHGTALLDAGGAILPASVPTSGYAVAATAGVVVLLGLRRGGALAGWLAVASLLTIAVAAILGMTSDFGRSIGVIGRGLGEAFSGAPAATPWVGADPLEIATVALVFAVPPLAASTGIVGALHGAARAKTTRRQGATALLGPILFAVISTLLVMAYVGSGAFYHRAQTSRPFADLLVYQSDFATRSQRDEPERLHTGYLRIVDGDVRDLSLQLATEQASIDNPRFEFRGNPADVALHLADGRVERMLRPRDGTLNEVDLSELADLVVFGEMLPRGGALVSESMTRGSGGDLAARLTFIALLLLLAVGAGAFGLALGRSLPSQVPKWAPMAAGLVPAAGIAAATTGMIPGLSLIGGIAAAVTVTIAAIVIAARARQAT